MGEEEFCDSQSERDKKQEQGRQVTTLYLAYFFIGSIVQSIILLILFEKVDSEDVS